MQGGARPGAGRKPANFDHERARKLKAQGVTYAEIADRFGVTVDAIKWFFKKEGQRNKLERVESIPKSDRGSPATTESKATKAN